MQDSIQLQSQFRLGQRVHFVGDPRRTGTVAFIGTLEGYSGMWVGVDWDDNNGKHDGSINGVRYFQAKSERSGSFVRFQNLSLGISLLQALELRYRGDSTKEEEDEMYVLSASDKRVSVQFVGKDLIKDKLSRFEELTSVSLSYMGVSSLGNPCQIGSVLPNLKQLDLTGNLLSDWKDISIICDQLQALVAIILSNNLLSCEISGPLQLKHIRILVLNNTGITWMQVEILKHSLPAMEELHLMGNNISEVKLHNKKQNRLAQSRLNDLVFIKYNRALKRRYNLRDIVDPISLKDIDDSNEWLIGRLDDDSEEEDELVFDNDSLTWCDVSRAVGAKEPSFYSRASTSRAKTNVSCSSLSTTQRKQVNLDDFNLEEEDTDGYKSNERVNEDEDQFNDDEFDL